MEFSQTQVIDDDDDSSTASESEIEFQFQLLHSRNPHFVSDVTRTQDEADKLTSIAIPKYNENGVKECLISENDRDRDMDMDTDETYFDSDETRWDPSSPLKLDDLLLFSSPNSSRHSAIEPVVVVVSQKLSSTPVLNEQKSSDSNITHELEAVSGSGVDLIPLQLHLPVSLSPSNSKSNPVLKEAQLKCSSSSLSPLNTLKSLPSSFLASNSSIQSLEIGMTTQSNSSCNQPPGPKRAPVSSDDEEYSRNSRFQENVASATPTKNHSIDLDIDSGPDDELDGFRQRRNYRKKRIISSEEESSSQNHHKPLVTPIELIVPAVIAGTNVCRHQNLERNAKRGLIPCKKQMRGRGRQLLCKDKAKKKNPFVLNEAMDGDRTRGDDDLEESDMMSVLAGDGDDLNNSFIVAAGEDGEDLTPALTDSQQHAMYMRSVMNIVPIRCGRIEKPQGVKFQPVIDLTGGTLMASEDTQSQYINDSFCTSDDQIEYEEVGVYTQSMIDAEVGLQNEEINRIVRPFLKH